MPKKLEKCVKKVSKTIKSRKGSKKSAAFGVCTAAMKRKKK